MSQNIERKCVVMPNSEQIVEDVKKDPGITNQLLLGARLGEDVATAMVVFIKTLANRLGGKEIDGFGLNDQWTRAAADTLRTPPTAGVLVRTNIIGTDGVSFFERFMTIITPDPDVLADCIDIRKRYEEELNRLGVSERGEWAHLGDW